MSRDRIFSLVYASEATAALTDQQLDALLAVSRANNARAGVTGMLLYKEGTFMQALEGDERTVRKAFRRIGRDNRHTGVRLLSAKEVPVRQFGEWTMGYRRVSEDAPSATAGFDDFLSRGDFGPSWATPTPARMLLDWFRLYAGQANQPAPPSLPALR